MFEIDLQDIKPQLEIKPTVSYEFRCRECHVNLAEHDHRLDCSRPSGGIGDIGLGPVGGEVGR